MSSTAPAYRLHSLSTRKLWAVNTGLHQVYIAAKPTICQLKYGVYVLYILDIMGAYR